MFSQLVKFYSIIIFLFLFFFSPVIAQQKYNFEHISMPGGLSNPAVWDIVQDQYGFLWIATSDGLNCYDGYNFKIYKNDPRDRNSLPNNAVHSLMIDHDGTLWVGTSAGFSKFNRANESFETLLLDSNSVSLSSNLITKIVQDSKNRIWLLSPEDIFMFDKNMNKIKQLFLKDGDNKLPVRGEKFALLETSSGEIYAGFHFKGLIKYNESDKLFEWINVDSKKPNIFEHHTLLNLYEDKTGKIWISSQNGFYNYDPQTGNFNEINLIKKAEDVGESWTNGVGGVYQDDNGFLWIATITNGIFRYDMKTNEIITLKESEYPISVHNFNGFWKLYKDEFGVLWIGTQNNGLLKLDFQKEPFRLYPNPADKTNLNSNVFITSIYKSPSNKTLIWLGTNEGLVKYNLNDKTFIKFKYQEGKDRSIPDNNINDILHVSANELWLGTGKGISLMNLSDNTFTNYEFAEKTKHYSFDYNNINSLSMDDYGNLWAASRGRGIVKFDTKNKTSQFISTFNYRTYDLNLLDFIDSLNTKGNTLAQIVKVVDYQNLRKEFKIDKQTEVMIVAAGEGDNTNKLMYDYGWVIGGKSDTVWSQSNFKNSFYMGGANKNRITVGIITLHKGDYTLRYKSDDSHSYGKWNAAPPPDSTLWGIQAFALSNSDAAYYKSLITDSRNKTFIDGDIIGKIEYQNDGTVLIATTSGLSKYDIRKNTVEHLQDGTKTAFTQNMKYINDFYVDKNSVVWMATDGGLIKYDQNSRHFNMLYDRDGLPSNYVEAIEEDIYENLWISTLNGISKFNKDVVHPIFINYDVKDGLQGYSFNQRASFESGDGELFFAGQNGFNAFHSSNINKQLPIIDITQLKISNETVTPSTENSPLTKSILDTKSMTLAYSQNNISFEFSAIHFSRPDKNQYAYRMDGFDKKGWIYDNRRFATYTNLPPGDYVFRVIASNGDGIWNKTGASIKITVLPPWWLTIWAYIMYFFVFAGGVFVIDRTQRKRLLAKAREQAKFQEAEMRAQLAEAESERKSKELEEARQLQLSMLPKELPDLPNLDIAVYMKTATEVGGDYYDFHVGLDGTLTVVVGDATGHGMKAGTMVTATKSLFNILAPSPDVLTTFSEISRILKGMRFNQLSMCLLLIKIKGDQLTASSAAMPPALIYRKKNRAIEEIFMKGMPLGTINNFPYTIKESHLEQGDTILVLSDGLPELKNSNNEIFGYDRTKTEFHSVGEKEPEEIVNHLKTSASDWINNEDPGDDITFVVIKVK